MPVLNIRLSDEDAALVKRLRQKGVNLSEIARAALREAAAKLKPSKKTAAEIIAEIQARHPAPADAKPLGIDLTDRHAMSKHMFDHIAAKQKRIADDLNRHKRSHRARRSA